MILALLNEKRNKNEKALSLEWYFKTGLVCIKIGEYTDYD
jgi:hypothetical protein